jgi:SpoVK/Ycf46/Vps4 family AAA+-type ATPase
MDDAVIASLRTAVIAAPDDVALRLHLADLLIQRGFRDEAITHVAIALSHDPESAQGRRLMALALGSTTPAAPEANNDVPDGDAFDWGEAEQDLGDVVPPMFVTAEDESARASAFDVEDTGIRLADVGGMTDVKKRLNAAFIAPLRNPELRQLYGKSLRGGLLLYGPPGCGKTFLARAVAGELEAAFLTVSLADVLDMYIGNSEKNIKELFEVARAAAPCVLFLDEIDALGQKRTLTRNSASRNSVNQLLNELDGIGSTNDGVFVLAATNHPWDVDPALRRPGRLDRTLLVLPPDRPARESIFRYHLAERPIENIDLGRLAKRTEGFSGADIAHVCESAAELALMDSIESGDTRMIGMADLEAALGSVRSSIGPWLETARNVALFANESGEYDELAKFIRKSGRL